MTQSLTRRQGVLCCFSSGGLCQFQVGNWSNQSWGPVDQPPPSLIIFGQVEKWTTRQRLEPPNSPTGQEPKTDTWHGEGLKKNLELMLQDFSQASWFKNQGRPNIIDGLRFSLDFKTKAKNTQTKITQNTPNINKKNLRTWLQHFQQRKTLRAKTTPTCRTGQSKAMPKHSMKMLRSMTKENPSKNPKLHKLHKLHSKRPPSRILKQRMPNCPQGPAHMLRQLQKCLDDQALRRAAQISRPAKALEYISSLVFSNNLRTWGPKCLSNPEIYLQM